MRRYLLFRGPRFYPSGGWRDFGGSFATVEEARAAFLVDEFWSYSWWHVVDAEAGRVVAEGSGQP